MIKRSIRYFIGFFILIILFSVLHYTGKTGGVEGGVIQVFGSIQRPFSYVGQKTSSVFQFFSSVGELYQHNQELIEENRRLQAEHALLAEVKKENVDLRGQLDLVERTDFPLITSQVIGRDPSNASREIVIDKGRTNGVNEQAAVIISNGVLIGKVVEVFETKAKVMLITDGNSLVNALVQESRSSGIVRGQHGLGLLIDTIPQNEHIEKGNTIITSGLGGVFPKGLLIGTVKEITDSDNELFQEAIVSPGYHIRDLEVVFIVGGE